MRLSWFPLINIYMLLKIDTSKKDSISIEVSEDRDILLKKKIPASFSQAERLLPEIDFVLSGLGKSSRDIKKIEVSDEGISFTALRIGVVTANALSYALGVPVKSFSGKNIKLEGIEMVRPKYSAEPNISVSNKKI